MASPQKECPDSEIPGAGDRPVANLTASENEPNVDETAFENQAVANIISTRTPPRLLDLPRELRLMIFRHLLVCPRHVDFGRWASDPSVSVAILRTCKSIHSEASDVLYRENQFQLPNYMWLPFHSVIRFRQALETMQNIYVGIPPSFGILIQTFLTHIHHFRDTSIIRGTLTVEFFVARFKSCRPLAAWATPLRWMARALGRFTHFRTIELHINHFDCRDRIFDVLEYLEAALEPVFGHSDHGSREGHGLRFHPLDYRNRSREAGVGDWADLLDGVRLEWNEDAKNANGPETPVQN